MINRDALNDLANKLTDALPSSLKEMHTDLVQNFKTILEASFAKMNLVTREEFDKQTAILHKAREKLDQLEAQLEAKQHKGKH